MKLKDEGKWRLEKRTASVTVRRLETGTLGEVRVELFDLHRSGLPANAKSNYRPIVVVFLDGIFGDAPYLGPRFVSLISDLYIILRKVNLMISPGFGDVSDSILC